MVPGHYMYIPSEVYPKFEVALIVLCRAWLLTCRLSANFDTIGIVRVS